jgi:hypothetical protein
LREVRRVGGLRARESGRVRDVNALRGDRGDPAKPRMQVLHSNLPADRRGGTRVNERNEPIPGPEQDEEKRDDDNDGEDARPQVRATPIPLRALAVLNHNDINSQPGHAVASQRRVMKASRDTSFVVSPRHAGEKSSVSSAGHDGSSGEMLQPLLTLMGPHSLHPPAPHGAAVGLTDLHCEDQE